MRLNDMAWHTEMAGAKRSNKTATEFILFALNFQQQEPSNKICSSLSKELKSRRDLLLQDNVACAVLLWRQMFSRTARRQKGSAILKTSKAMNDLHAY
jgi:hypothetical protein